MGGSSNQQGSGVGVILEGPSGLLINQALRFAFKANNNQAKYEALIAGMLLAKELGAQSLVVKSNSLLVTGQVTGEYCTALVVGSDDVASSYGIGVLTRRQVGRRERSRGAREVASY